MNTIQIAIDGPAGAGKSTIAKYIADKLGFLYVDTGAMYRAVAYYFIKNDAEISTENPNVVDLLENISIELIYNNGVTRVLLCGDNVTNEIRHPDISVGASKVAVIGAVREKLASMQRDMAKGSSIVMDGRDIGTNVLPNAQIKLFLTATSTDRAIRRTIELKEKGIACDFQKVKEDIEFRDHNDSTRIHSPLKQAADAIVIDTTGNELNVSKQIVLSVIKERMNCLV